MRRNGSVAVPYGEDAPPGAVRRLEESGGDPGWDRAWCEAWDEMVRAIDPVTVEGNYGMHRIPAWPQGELSLWAVGLHADGKRAIYRLWMDWGSADDAVWLAEDIAEPGLDRPPLDFLTAVPPRSEGEEPANRRRWRLTDDRVPLSGGE